MPTKKLLEWEKDLLSTYVSEHPLQALARLPDGVSRCSDIDVEMKGQQVEVAGMVTDARVITTKNSREMAFVQLEDLQGSIEIVVFPNVFKDTGDLWVEDTVVIVQGRVDDRDGNAKILCQSVKEYEPGSETHIMANHPRLLNITFERTRDLESDRKLLGQICELLKSYEGQDRYSLHVVSQKGVYQVDFPNYTTKYNPELQRKLSALLGRDALHLDWA